MWSAALFVAVLTNSKLLSDSPTIDLASLERAAALYREFNLPLPPVGQPLEIFESVDLIKGQKRRSVLCVAYRIDEDASKTHFLEGSQRLSLDANQFKEILGRQAKQREATNTAIKESFYRSHPFRENLALGIAIQEHIKGHDRFAIGLLKQLDGVWEGFDRYYPREKVKTLEGEVVRLEFSHLLNRIEDSGEDRNRAFSELSGLSKRFPDVRGDIVDDALAGYQAVTSHLVKSSDPLEQKIDSLCSCCEDGKRLESPDPSKTANFVTLRGLVSQAYQSIPHLIEHFDDQRLSYAVSPARMNGFPRLISVGEICTNLASQLATISPKDAGWDSRKDAIKIWWATASHSDPSEICLDKLESTKYWYSPAAVLWAEGSFPSILLQEFNKVLIDGTDQNLAPLLSAMERSTLSREVVTDAARRGALSPNIDQTSCSLITLKALNPVSFSAYLPAAIRRCPKAPEDSREMHGVLAIAMLGARSDSPEVWDLLTSLTKSVSVSLRHQIISSMKYQVETESARRMFLQFGLKFFSDSGLPTFSGNPRFLRHSKYMYEQRDYKTVGDEAAAAVAYQLNRDDVPDKNSRKQKWNTYRKTLLIAVKNTL